MPESMDNEQMAAYSEAAKSGLYAKRSGLIGKYDNVRKYWEDEISRKTFYPYLRKLIEKSQSRMHRLRILDLGCGSADGYELLCGIRQRDPGLKDSEVDLLTPDVLGVYKGVDLNKDLMEQAKQIYGHNPKMIFEQGDFTRGLPGKKKEKPWDLYFTSYGTCSHHNTDETFVKMMVDIAEHVSDYAIVVCDWVGRFSYEWQSLWTNDFDKVKNMDYVVSYIYPKEKREAQRDKLQHLTLRLVSRKEAEAMISRANKESGADIKTLNYFDRSVFTGRHMDTAEYNPHAQPVRQAVNSLHEINLRTDLGSLLINYVPKNGFEELNEYFGHLQMCWNHLVHYTIELLHKYDEKRETLADDLPEISASYPPPLRTMMERMRRVIEGVGWLGIGLPRENIIEPQLGYALRYLISNLQKGRGCAHGLVGIFEIDKT